MQSLKISSLYLHFRLQIDGFGHFLSSLITISCMAEQIAVILHRQIKNLLFNTQMYQLWTRLLLFNPRAVCNSTGVK